MIELKKNKYGNKSRLLFTDTDRLMYEIKTEGIYEEFNKGKKYRILVIMLLSQNIMMIQRN